MNLHMNGKTALVTGSTAGIGLVISQGLAREGAQIWINWRSEERVEQALRGIREAVPGAQAAGVAADFASGDGARRVTEKLGHVDILINDVGIFDPKPFAEITDEEWFRFFEVNVMSGVRLQSASH